MCGRFTRLYEWRKLHELLDLRYPAPEEMRPSWNVAPSQTTPVCRLDENGEREIALMQWGFTPRWSKEPGAGPIIARSETVATRGMFRDAYRARRCLVPISGFYEWRTTVSGRQPHYVRLLNDEVFCLAGVWERSGDGDDTVETFAILTTEPNEVVAEIHDRMPVIIRREDYDTWLSGDKPPESLFRPFPAEEMEAFPVSMRVNSPKNDEPGLCERAAPDRGLFDAAP